MADADALRTLRERVEAAERIVRESSVPPRGWASSSELEARTLRGLLDALPPELARQLVEALRQVLLALRALIDWYLERLDRDGPRDARVEDIPID